MGLSTVLKYNPYHDKFGRFSSKVSSNSVSSAFDQYYDSPSSTSSGYIPDLPLKSRRIKRTGKFTIPLQEDVPVDENVTGTFSLAKRRVNRRGTTMSQLHSVLKFNPYHDPKNGRFSSKGGAASQSTFTLERGTTNSLSSAQVPNYGEYDQKILAAETAGDKKLAKKLRDDMDREEVESRGLVRANDLKKGTRVMLRSGWEADLADNAKGNTRLAKVYGDYTEMGSVYTKDILEAKVGENWKKVALSAAQRKAAKKIRAAGW